MEPIVQWLTVLQYAEAHELSDRTVQRWLKGGKLPGATHTNKGWLIPADARPPAPSSPAAPAAQRGASRELAVPAPAALEQRGPRNLSEALDELPAYVPLQRAAALLGISWRVIAEYPEEFGARPFGARERGGERALVVPARTIRDTAGL